MYSTIQASRAIAAIFVVLFHLAGTIALDKYFGERFFENIFSFGHSGVDFFFVLSGFIITYVHWNDFGKRDRLFNFIRKRAIRIYPIYWIIFFVVAIGALSSPTLRSAVPLDPVILLKSLTLIPQDPLVIGGTGAPLIIVAWSLQYELLFYCVMAVFVMSIRIGYITIFLLAVLGAINWKTTTFPIAFIANEWLYLFAMGALVGGAVRTNKTVANPTKLSTFGILIFLATVLFEVFFAGKDTSSLRWFYGAGSAIAIYGLIQMEDLGIARDWNHPWLLKLGDASYVLYLIHFPLIILLCKASIKVGLHGFAGAIFSYIFIFIICLYCAVLLHDKVEKPLLLKMSGKNNCNK